MSDKLSLINSDISVQNQNERNDATSSRNLIMIDMSHIYHDISDVSRCIAKMTSHCVILTYILRPFYMYVPDDNNNGLPCCM